MLIETTPPASQKNAYFPIVIYAKNYITFVQL